MIFAIIINNPLIINKDYFMRLKCDNNFSLSSTPFNITLFPIEHYNQNIDNFICCSDPDYYQALLNEKEHKNYFDVFLQHYYGDSKDSLSPWCKDFVIKNFSIAKSEIIKSINQFDNSKQEAKNIIYGINYHPYNLSWIKNIVRNINFNQIQNLSYNSAQRAIAVKNLPIRNLPTYDPGYYNHQIAGEGYPFDRLQLSSVFIGTPLYIVAETIDLAWLYIMTPGVIGWVSAEGVARADNVFISEWQQTAMHSLVSVIDSETSIYDERQNFYSLAYPGTILPMSYEFTNAYQTLLPVDNKGMASIKKVQISKTKAIKLPLPATPNHFCYVIKKLINRSYGWGGLNYYNDCSSELKILFSYFGIWLPRNSTQQALQANSIDLSHLSMIERMTYLKTHGHKLTTLIYVDNHIMLYLGNYQINNETLVMTYQNVWGLKNLADTYRAVIGKSILFPLLTKYPEDTSLISQANLQNFKLIFLN